MRRIAANMLVGLLILGACGGDDDKESDGDAATSAADDTQDSDTETTGSPDDIDGDTEPSIDIDGGGSFNSAECQELADAFNQEGLSDAVTGLNGDPTAQLEEGAERLAAAAEDAPEEIREDIEILAEVYGELAAASGDIDWEGVQAGDASSIAALTQFAGIYANNPDLISASTNLATYVAETCT